jgi:hypothetical protein
LSTHPHGEHYLRGNGAFFVRELALAKRVQAALERLHGLDRVVELDAYVHVAEGNDGRETLLVRDPGDGAIELELHLPRLLDGNFDRVSQIVEGVSHFVYVTHRAANDRQTTQLELEIQAEVDKYAFFASMIAEASSFCREKSTRLRERLYGNVQYTSNSAEELARYREANAVASRYTGKLQAKYLDLAKLAPLREQLRKFFQSGLGEKLHAAA